MSIIRVLPITSPASRKPSERVLPARRLPDQQLDLAGDADAIQAGQTPWSKRSFIEVGLEAYAALAGRWRAGFTVAGGPEGNWQAELARRSAAIRGEVAGVAAVVLHRGEARNFGVDCAALAAAMGF